MIKLILAYFGYAKVPVAAVKLSTEQEFFIERMIERESSKLGKAWLEDHLKRQKVLTEFLRSCTQLN